MLRPDLSPVAPRISLRPARWLAVSLTAVLVFAAAAECRPADDSGSVAARKTSSKSSTSRSSSRQSSEEGPTDSRLRRSQYDDGGGVEARLGYLGFQTFGRDDSIGHVELLPYLMADEEMIFADLRGFVSNEGLFGGNAGVGYRRWLPGVHRVVGASLWYDGDDTTGMMFHQVGLNLETYGRMWDFRGNFYFPILDTDRELASRAINLRFADTRLLFDHQREVREAMEGLDLEVGFLLPSEFAHDHNFRAYAGWYYFLGDQVDDINGYRVRLEGNVTQNISTQVEFTDDQTYGQNVMLGVAIQFSGGLHRATPSGVSKTALMRRYVQRNYNIIAPRQTTTEVGLAAINPDTDMPYVVRHVASGAGGQGGLDDPYGAIADAQADNPDLIFVHSGSVFDTPLVLGAGDRVLGEGAEHSIVLSGFGTFALPGATGGMDLPRFEGISGDAVALASGAEFSGFVIDSPTGRGIVGDSIDGALVSQVQILNSGGAGVSLLDSRGDINLLDVQISGSTGPAFLVDGGRPDVTFTGSIDNTTGLAVQIADTTGGAIDLSGATIRDNGGNGVAVLDVDGDVQFGDVDIRNSVASGIRIEGGEGDVFFAGETVVRNSAAAGVDIQDTEGTIAFADLNVVSNGQTALLVRNANRVEIADGVLDARGGGAAADIEDSRTAILLRSVFADGGPFGVRIADSKGSFIVIGGEGAGSGGLIQNTVSGVLLDGAGTVAFQFLDLDGNDVGIQANDVDQLVLARSRVTDSAAFGLDLKNVRALEVSNSEFRDNVGSSLRAVFSAKDDYSYVIAGNVIDDRSAAALSFATQADGAGSSLSLNVNTNRITTRIANADGVNINWNGTLAAALTNNVFTGRQEMSDGIDITTVSTTKLAEIVIGQNDFLFRDDDSTGLRIDSAGPSRLTVTANEIVFGDNNGDGANGVGMNFTLAESATVNIFNNVIVDNVASGTGILFDSIDGPSTVAIDGNVINLLSPGAAIDRGIIFTNVNGTITLSGSTNNVVNGATTPFFIPGGSATTDGTSILVNGVSVP